MPAGSGVQLPAGAKLTIEIGYRGSMDEASGAGELGLYFAEKAPAQTPASIEITPAPVNVAPGKIGERFRAETAIKTRDDDRGDVAAARSRRAIDRGDGDSSRRQRRADAVGEQLSAPNGPRPTS